MELDSFSSSSDLINKTGKLLIPDSKYKTKYKAASNKDEKKSSFMTKFENMRQMSQSKVDFLLHVCCSTTHAKCVVRPPGVSYNITHIIEGGTAQCIRHSLRCRIN